MARFRRILIGSAAAAVLATVGAAAPASASGSSSPSFGQQNKGTTTVVLDPTAAGALVGLGVAPVTPGALTAPNGMAQVAFPITRVSPSGAVYHAGGLSFSVPKVQITSFAIYPKSGYLTASARVGGKWVGRIPVFKLGATQPINGKTPSCSGIAAGLTLTGPAAAALGVPSAKGLFIGDACVVPMSKGATTVTLDPTAANALVSLGVAPVRPGTLAVNGGLVQAAFPITKTWPAGIVNHAGGLSFSGPDVKIQRFVVNTKTGYLTASTTVGGKWVGRVPVFQLGATQPINGSTPSCAGIAAGLTLTPQAAGALGVPSAAGLFVGDACVVPGV